MKKLFVLGPPGSGKSTVARYIVETMRQQGLWSERVNDYSILKRKFDEQNHAPEKAPRRFYPLEQGGFYIMDRIVCDEVLRELDETVAQLSLSNPEGIIVIEFARNNYLHAFNQFQNGLPRDAYILFLLASLPVCKERIENRSVHPKTEDDYFVSDYTFEFYYGKDTEEYLAEECSCLSTSFGVALSQLKIIQTDKHWQDVEMKVDEWIKTVCFKNNQTNAINSEYFHSNSIIFDECHRSLPETGPLQHTPETSPQQVKVAETVKM